MSKFYLYLLQKYKSQSVSLLYVHMDAFFHHLKKQYNLFHSEVKRKTVVVLQMTHWGCAVALQYICICHRWVVSTFIYAAQGLPPPAISSSKSSPLDSSQLAAFSLGNRNTGCSRDCPCHHPFLDSLLLTTDLVDLPWGIVWSED